MVWVKEAKMTVRANELPTVQAEFILSEEEYREYIMICNREGKGKPDLGSALITFLGESYFDKKMGN